MPVVTSTSPQDTASMILTIAKQEQDSPSEPTKKSGRRSFSDNDYIENVIANASGIGPKLARLLLEHFRSIGAIARAEIKELCKVDRIGKKKTEGILRILDMSYCGSEP
ncbi:MAG: helix-hairpin-helix domain-containing protein [Candidatus Micrarchaeia archaeon]